MDLKKFNLAVPRYTSFPTVPFWKTQDFKIDGYERTLEHAYWESSKEVSIYIHLPFCESLCTYCACNTRVTKNHSVEIPYISYLQKEWKLYLDRLPGKPVIKEIHLGGGTPTFFSPENLSSMLEGILGESHVAEDPKFSFEGHPANTTVDHLMALKDLGFSRVSFGIQDFDPRVQKLINRMQSYEQVKYITEQSRALGYESVNFDMVYGLPGQTIDSMKETMDRVLQLRPDRIAYYSYAHVPQLKPAQKSYERHLPTSEEKYEFSTLGKEVLINSGYHEVGMDHFVLPDDELLKARQLGNLHRNFMGYTSFNSKLLIGLGVSAISDSWSGFAQNEKTIPAYYEKLDQQELPIVRGHLHSVEDLFLRKHILNLMCGFKTAWYPDEFMQFGLGFNHQLLAELKQLEFIDFNEHGLEVLAKGKEIIRIICSALDRDFTHSASGRIFSQSI